MTELKGTLYTAYTQFRNTYLAFWGFVLLFIVLNLIVISFFDNIKVELTLVAPVFILGIIIPWYMLKQLIPYLVKIGTTRLSAYLGSGIFLLVTTIINVIMVQVVKGVFGLIFQYEAGTALYVNGESSLVLSSVFSHTMFNFNLWETMLIDLVVTLVVTVSSLIMATIFKRYGKVVGFLVAAVIASIFILITTTGTASSSLLSILNFVVDHAGFYYTYIVLALSLGLYFFNYIFLRKLSVS